MLEALKEGGECQEEFKAFDIALRAEHPVNVSVWEKEVAEYAVDKTKPCPYMISSKSKFAGFLHVPFRRLTMLSAMTLDEAKCNLLAQEKEDQRTGRTTLAGSDGPSAFVVAGLDIEAKQ